MPEDIFEWSDIEDDYDDGLLLGNGASIAFYPRFEYGSIGEEARQRDLITSDVQRIFDDLRTSDFELVLRVLWHAQRVNEALEIPDDRTEEAYLSVRNALIEVVGAIHPVYSEVERKLENAASFMGRFHTVISLNYDVLVYWAMLLGNSSSPNRFKDCWINGEFQFDWERFREPFGGNVRSTLVFFPHGNIVLGSDLFGVERKLIAREFSSLLSTVLAKWEDAEATPIFVSEGTTEQKRAAIARSPYLSTVLEEVLPTFGATIVVHGSSFAEADAHLFDAICRGRPERFAIGVDPTSDALAEFCGRVTTQLERRLGRGRFEIVFYDRQSAGCWVDS